MSRRLIAGMLVVLVLALGSSAARAADRWGDEGLNPLEFHGPHFLWFYAVAFVMVLTASVMIRRGFRQPDGSVDEVLGKNGLAKFDPYEAAYLAGGKKLAAGAAVAGLVQRGVVEADTTSYTLTITAGHKVGKTHPLEKAVLDAIETGDKKFKTVVDGAAIALDEMESRLHEAGLLVSNTNSVFAKILGAVPLWALLWLGIWKAGVGLSRAKPVGFLIVFCLFTGLISLIFLLKPIFRTRLGDRVLERLRADHSALKTSGAARMDHLTPADLALATGLFGFGILNHGSLLPLHSAIAPPSAGGHGCGGGSGCGGGGGGCGGGGCGGGGCGGCGS